MHPNAALLHKLFGALDRHDHAEMASCYRDDAEFHDIAFDLPRRKRIAGMWRFICSGDIRVEIEDVRADDHIGEAWTVDRYTFGILKREVVNPIHSRFVFRNGRIASQNDLCDAKAWARQALGKGPLGFAAGRSRFVRSLTARLKLGWFLLTHPT